EKHADRNKEHSRKNSSKGKNFADCLLSEVAFTDDQPTQKSAQRQTNPRQIGYHSRSKTNRYNRQQEKFLASCFCYLFKNPRNDPPGQHQYKDDDDHSLAQHPEDI